MESCDSFGRRTTLATFIHPPSFNKGSESLTKPIVVPADSVNPSIIIRKRRDTTLLKRKKLYTLIKCLSIQLADLIYDIMHLNSKFGKVFEKRAVFQKIERVFHCLFFLLSWEFSRVAD